MAAAVPPSANDAVYLHPDVAVRTGEGHVDLCFAHWELRLPGDAIESDPEVRSLIGNRSTPTLERSHFAAGVKCLLEAQGCLLRDIPARMTLREFFRMLQPIRSSLYSTYYAHPLWSRLASGEAELGQFAAWVLHNYHVSRSAGVIAARRAVRTREPSARNIFRKDALDEFWHCDAFYFVGHPQLPLEPGRCKAYVPLPASRAFEDLALRAAADDGLTHLLIAYFQESSIVFRRDCEEFYDRVEAQYDLPGFFNGWRRHLALDIDEDHAGGLAALFDSDRSISRDEAERAIGALQMAHFFLVAALDQASAFTGDAASAISDRQPERLRERLANASAGNPATEGFRDRLVAAARAASFEALARARTHDEIMAAGRLAAALERCGSEAPPELDRNPWSAAARNFLLERSGEVGPALRLAQETIGFCREGAAGNDEGLARIAAEIDRSVACIRAEDCPVGRFALRELLALAEAAGPLPPLLIDRAGLNTHGKA